MSNVSTGWELPSTEIAARDVVQTGPSGVVLGSGSSGPVTLRLFGPRPTRVFIGAEEYLTWLLAFRCLSMGAHLSIVASDAKRWQGLVETVRRCGGTVDVVSRGRVLPSSGRPYRPSLVVDDAGAFESIQGNLGPWQAVFSLGDAAASGAVFALRNCDIALVSPADAKVQENLRRAYSLTSRQLKRAVHLGHSEVALAMNRRLLRLPVPPTASEYRLLFGGV